MVAYGPWTTYSGIRQSAAAPVPAWIPFKYRNTPSRAVVFGGTDSWYISQSFASYGALLYPHADLNARLCALNHAAEGEEGLQLDWDPGESPALTHVPAYGAVGVALGIGNPLPVGSSASWQGPPLYLLPATYTCFVYHTGGGIQFVPDWYRDSLPPYGDAREVDIDILTQIPGWLAAVGDGLDPDVQALRVDGEASLAVLVPQTRLANAMTVTAHTRADDHTLTPYSGLGATAMTVAASLGSTSSTVTFTDMQPGDVHKWDLASSRIRSALDPGEFESNTADVNFVGDFVWSVRIRFQIPDVLAVCRWRQRDDGLGVTAAARHRTGTSLQRGMRQRGYR